MLAQSIVEFDCDCSPTDITRQSKRGTRESQTTARTVFSRWLTETVSVRALCVFKRDEDMEHGTVVMLNCTVLITDGSAAAELSISSTAVRNAWLLVTLHWVIRLQFSLPSDIISSKVLISYTVGLYRLSSIRIVVAMI